MNQGPPRSARPSSALTSLCTAAALLTGCGPETVALQFGAATLQAEIADSDAERQVGLMYRDSMGQDAGMIFVYPDTKIRSFWMKDTRIPLSIAFLDDTGTIVRIADMRPFDTGHTSSMVPARYAVEANQGWFAEHNIEAGAKVTGIDSLSAK